MFHVLLVRVLRYVECWYNVAFSALANFMLQAQPITPQIVVYFKIAGITAVQTHVLGVSEKFLASAIFRLIYQVPERRHSDVTFIPNFGESAWVPSCTASRSKRPSVSDLVSNRPLFRPSAVVSVYTTDPNMKNLSFCTDGVFVWFLTVNNLYFSIMH